MKSLAPFLLCLPPPPPRALDHFWHFIFPPHSLDQHKGRLHPALAPPWALRRWAPAQSVRISQSQSPTTSLHRRTALNFGHWQRFEQDVGTSLASDSNEMSELFGDPCPLFRDCRLCLSALVGSFPPIET